MPARTRRELHDDLGPGAGSEGGRIVAAGPPAEVAKARGGRTAPFLARALRGERAPALRASAGTAGEAMH
jgi:hypothetical protein